MFYNCSIVVKLLIFFTASVQVAVEQNVNGMTMLRDSCLTCTLDEAHCNVCVLKMGKLWMRSDGYRFMHGVKCTSEATRPTTSFIIVSSINISKCFI